MKSVRACWIRPVRSAAPMLGALLAALLAASPVRAGVPSPSNWTVPPMILVVGEDGNGIPDSVGEFTIDARDLANQPMAGVLVTIDFSGCNDIRLAANPQDPDAIVDCALRTVSKHADANGIAVFRIAGSCSAPPGSPGSGLHCVPILGDGVVQFYVDAATIDLTGGDGLGPADFSAWLDDFFGGLQPIRSDFDHSGDLGAADLSRMLDIFFASGSITNNQGGGACPN